MVPIDLLDAGLWQALNLYKMQYLGSTVKQGMSIVLKQAIKIRLPQKLKVWERMLFVMFLLNWKLTANQKLQNNIQALHVGWMEHRGQSPTLKLGDACLLVPWGLILLFLSEESATTTSSDWDVNTGPSLHLLVGPPRDITDDLNHEILNWRFPNTGVGRAAPQWRVRSFLDTRSFITKMTGSKENPCISLLPPSSPIHPDTQSLHPETSINFSLCPQSPCSIHHTVHLAPLLYLAQVPPSHHFHCRLLRLSQKSREGAL